MVLKSKRHLIVNIRMSKSTLTVKTASTIFLMFLAGCATAPSIYTFEKSRNVFAPKDEIWGELMFFFTESNLDLTMWKKTAASCLPKGSSVWLPVWNQPSWQESEIVHHP